MRGCSSAHNHAPLLWTQGYAKSETEKVMFEPACVTITYNLARLYEDTGETAKADRLYTEILKHHPNYVDCYLRKGVIMRDCGEFAAAEHWFGRAIACTSSKLPPSLGEQPRCRTSSCTTTLCCCPPADRTSCTSRCRCTCDAGQPLL